MSTPAKFSAFRIRDDEAGYRAGIESMSADELSPGEILISAAYSSVNYKDALAGTGKGKILRRFPLNRRHRRGRPCGGIDRSGFREGDAVLCTGSGLSETRDGGYGEFVRLEARLDDPPARRAEPARKHDPGHGRLHRRAGAVPHAAERQRPQMGPIVVTGATGGVGMLAIDILTRAGFEAHAITGKTDHADFLATLGATQGAFAQGPASGANGRWRRPSWAAPSTTSAASCWPACRA